MSQIKEKVRNYLKTDRSMSQGVVLYQSLQGRNLALANQLARLPDNDKNRKQLYYELCKLAGIAEGEKNSLLASRIQSPKQPKKVEPATKSKPSDPDEAGKDRFDSMPWNDIRKEASDLPEDFAPQGKKKDDLLNALRTFEAHKEAQKKKASEQPETGSNSGTNSPS